MTRGEKNKEEKVEQNTFYFLLRYSPSLNRVEPGSLLYICIEGNCSTNLVASIDFVESTQA